MTHPETHKVTLENGPRPAGKPDQCFYCKKMIGEDHAPSCVCRKRTVMMSLTFTVPVVVTEDWTKEDIDFYHELSSSCANNVITRLYCHQGETSKCLCGHLSATYLGEATAEQEVEHGYDVTGVGDE